MITEASMSIKRLGWDFPATSEKCLGRYRVHPLPARPVQTCDVRAVRPTLACHHPELRRDLVGYWMPHEGTNNIAFALISFEDLAGYENYRTRLRADGEAMANFNFAETNRFILAEERTFLRKVAL
jgi:hypothetical protein